MPLYVSNPDAYGSDNDDLIVPFRGTNAVLSAHGGGGNDAIFGNRLASWFVGGNSNQTYTTAFSIDDAAAWTVAGTSNPLIGDASLPSTTVYAQSSGGFFCFSLSLAAGATMTLDIDAARSTGSFFDSFVEVLDAATGAVLAHYDDSTLAAGGLGSDSISDSFGTFTAAAAGSYVVRVGRYQDESQSQALSNGDFFALVVSASGHAASSGATGGDGIFNGGSGNDYIVGYIGNDTITGDADDDQLFGAGGNDRFVWSQGDGSDLIDGGAGGDALDLSGATSGWSVDLLGGGAGDGAETLVLTSIEQVIGTDFDDVLRSAGAGSAVYGGSGDDRVLTALGQPEILDGGRGADTLDVSAFGGAIFTIDLVSGRTNFAGESFTNFDNVVSGATADTITGTSGANVLATGGGADTVDAGDGDDVVLGGTGANTLDGEDGFDTVSYADALSRVTVSLALQGSQQDTGVSLDTLGGFEAIIGSSQDDTLTGDELANTLNGGAGNDTLNGAGGDDTFVIGAGDLFAEDEIDGGDGFDTLDLTGSTQAWFIDFSRQIGFDGDEPRVDFRSIERVLGSAQGDELVAAGSESLFGMGGDDIVRAGNFLGGTLDGGDGVDTIDLSSFNFPGQVYTIDLAAGTTDEGDIILQFENLTSGNTADHVTGTTGANTIQTNDGDDVVLAGGGSDVILAGAGADTLNGGRGIDRMAGGDGDDSYAVDNAGDTVTEVRNQGVDLVRAKIDYTLGAYVEDLSLSGRAHVGTGNALDNRIAGGNGLDTLSGLGGIDTILGGGGADTIDGGVGDDVITGGKGADLLTGGRGLDTFRVATGDTGRTAASADTIADFRQSEGDRINLAAFDAIAGTPAKDTFRFIGASAFSNTAGQLRYEIGGGQTVLIGDTDGDGRADLQIKLTGEITLVAADFVGVRGANGGIIGGDRGAEGHLPPFHDAAGLNGLHIACLV